MQHKQMHAFFIIKQFKRQIMNYCWDKQHSPIAGWFQYHIAVFYTGQKKY